MFSFKAFFNDARAQHFSFLKSFQSRDYSLIKRLIDGGTIGGENVILTCPVGSIQDGSCPEQLSINRAAGYFVIFRIADKKNIISPTSVKITVNPCIPLINVRNRRLTVTKAVRILDTPNQ
jgi:hypothetical protein